MTTEVAESVALAAEVFDLDPAELTRASITRSFCRSAFAAHPDTGGPGEDLTALRLARRILENHLDGAPWRASTFDKPLDRHLDVRC